MTNDDTSLLKSQLYLLLILFGTACLVVTVYHFLRICFCNRRHRAGSRQPPFISRRGEGLTGPENTAVVLIPAHKFEEGSIEDNTCSVCLCDFEEGEELRTLPECAHSFHVPCIDMWLYSHSTCPICRTDVVPSPRKSPCLVDAGGPASSPVQLGHEEIME